MRDRWRAGIERVAYADEGQLRQAFLWRERRTADKAGLFSLFLDAVCSAENAFDDPLAGYLTRRARLTGDVLPA